MPLAVSPFRPHRGPEAVASPDEGEPSCSSAGSPATKSMAHPRVASPPFASPSKNPDARQTSTLSRIPAALLAGFLVCLLALGMFEALSTFIRSAPHVPLERAWSATAAGGDSSPIRREAANAVADDKPHTLVMYVYSNTNPQYPDNLKFFVRHGIPGCSGCRYVIIINEDEQHQAGALPELPANARYVWHENKCFDWGTFGWAFESGEVVPAGYKYYIFLNSSVRGPFLPPYLQGHMHFTDILTRKLTDDVKLVGPTISCGGMRLPGSDTRLFMPHVQSFTVATDAVGFDVLQRNGSVFTCHDKIKETILYSELGISAVILDAGYNLDCLISLYQGIDWRDKSKWMCNGRSNPYSDNAGTVAKFPLSTYELLFVKVKGKNADSTSHLARAAIAYDAWLSSDNRTNSQGQLLLKLGTIPKAGANDSAAIKCTGIWGDPGCPQQKGMITEEDVNSLLTAEVTDTHTHKNGSLGLHRWWSPLLGDGPGVAGRRRRVDEWVWNTTMGDADGQVRLPPRGITAPKLDECKLFFNPVYRFIYIKNTKTAGSSVLAALNPCPQQATLEEVNMRKGPPCTQWQQMVLAQGHDAFGYDSWASLWADYTVFATVRNVYDRAGSAYDYLLGRRKIRTGACRDPEFQQFAARPYMISLQDQLYSCNNVSHDWAHVETQASCLEADTGGFATDYLIRTSSIEEDLAVALETINSRRPDGMPPLNPSIGWKQKGPIAKTSDQPGEDEEDADTAVPISRHVEKFKACGKRCLGLIHAYYREDFDLLKYPAGKIRVPDF